MMHTAGMIVRSALVTLALGLGALGACSRDGTPPMGVEWPLCSMAFVEGRSVPADAKGCTDGSGHHEPYRRIDCANGTPMFTYAEDLWTENLVVVHGNEDEFARAVAECERT